jgi:hypothetical protein
VVVLRVIIETATALYILLLTVINTAQRLICIFKIIHRCRASCRHRQAASDSGLSAGAIRRFDAFGRYAAVAIMGAGELQSPRPRLNVHELFGRPSSKRRMTSIG